MFLLVETIRSENGSLLNIRRHNERLNRSISDLYGLSSGIRLEHEIQVPEEAESGVYKCRVEYDTAIRKVEFIPYELRIIKSLKLIEDDNIDYSYKFADRKGIEALYSQRNECDDILVIKKGMITDSSYANVIFRDRQGDWFTPSAYLLAGTRRAQLLQDGFINETTIGYDDIGRYTEVKLINAMLNIKDSQGIPVSNLK